MTPDALIEHAVRVGLSRQKMTRLDRGIRNLSVVQAEVRLRKYNKMWDNCELPNGDSGLMSSAQRDSLYKEWDKAYAEQSIVQRAVFDMRRGIVRSGRIQVVEGRRGEAVG